MEGAVEVADLDVCAVALLAEEAVVEEEGPRLGLHSWSD